MLWFLSMASGLWFFKLTILPHLSRLSRGSGFETLHERRALAALQDLEETLQSGVTPSDGLWDRLCGLPKPWDAFVGLRLLELRRSGVALLPTVKRLKQLALFMVDLKAMAQSRSAQAWAQAWMCAILVPGVALILSYLLPVLGTQPWLWWGLASVSTLFCLGGAFWIQAIAQSSAWGGLKPARQGWILDSQVSLETLLSRIRSGQTPDIAWARMVESMPAQSRELGQWWRASVWATSTENRLRHSKLESLLIESGENVRRALQVSLMEGKPCSERIETALDSLRLDIRNTIQKELELLPTRALKPLFLCVAPAVLILVGSAVGLTALQGFEAWV